MWRCVAVLVTVAVLAWAEVNMEDGVDVEKETTKEAAKETTKDREIMMGEGNQQPPLC